jgi:hypothetical protein
MKYVTPTAWVAAVTSSVAWGGGSGVPVTVESLSVSGTSYTLVVVRAELGKDDPYMGRCARFTVLGTYWYLNGAFLNQPEILSRKLHLAALDYLQNALEKRLTVNLGWMGSGFMPIDASEPCVVRSRALLLMEDEGDRAVISFHNAI